MDLKYQINSIIEKKKKIDIQNHFQNRNRFSKERFYIEGEESPKSIVFNKKKKLKQLRVGILIF